MHDTSPQPDQVTRAGERTTLHARISLDARTGICKDGTITSASSYVHLKEPVAGDYFNHFIMICLEEAWGLNLERATSTAQQMYLDLFLKLRGPFAELRADPNFTTACSRVYALLVCDEAYRRDVMKRIIWKQVHIHQYTDCIHDFGDYLKIAAPAFELCADRCVEEEQSKLSELLRCVLDVTGSSGSSRQIRKCSCPCPAQRASLARQASLWDS